MKELAPAEDQGVVFGIVQASANSTLDQTKMFTTKVHDVYRSFPETDSIFQITGPTGGFSGHGDEAVERAHAHHRGAADGGRRRSWPRSPACA